MSPEYAANPASADFLQVSRVSTALKRLLKGVFFWLHRLANRCNLAILPIHYYSPVADITELGRTKNEWARKSELPGLRVNIEEQAKNLLEICLPYQSEFLGNQTYREAVAQHYGPGYGYVEAQALHGVIRHFKPRKVIEVGSGVSTHCMLAALALNEREGAPRAVVRCVEPYPSQRLARTPDITLIESKVQTIPTEFFAGLGEGDFLFIDSSHTVKPGSDVNYLVLEVLPRLRPGVVVHFHDIYLPYDYQRNVLQTFQHWSETSILRAFLVFNSRANIIFCLSQLYYGRGAVLREVFPEYRPQPHEDGMRVRNLSASEYSTQHFPSSLYLKITDDAELFDLNAHRSPRQPFTRPSA